MANYFIILRFCADYKIDQTILLDSCTYVWPLHRNHADTVFYMLTVGDVQPHSDFRANLTDIDTYCCQYICRHFGMVLHI